MASGSEVLTMLRPNGGWIISGDNYEDITWIDSEPLSKSDFEAGFDSYDSWKIEQDAKIMAKKAEAETKLAALGLTADDLKALGLGGN